MHKATYVREMFEAIAPRYDLTNRVLTAGADEGWRRRALAALAVPPGGHVLDLCCGTGDIAFHLVRTDPGLTVTGADFCEPMLEGARRRAEREDPRGRTTFVRADALALPFTDGSFDGAVMGFALRNVADIAAALREARRILKPGARFVNLDMSKAPNAAYRRLFNLYFYHVVPIVGGLVGGSMAAYRYLPNSLTHHPDADELARHFRSAGFSEVGYVRLAGGAIAVHSGVA